LDKKRRIELPDSNLEDIDVEGNHHDLKRRKNYDVQASEIVISSDDDSGEMRCELSSVSSFPSLLLTL
jgi:hypothetical protein